MASCPQLGPCSWPEQRISGVQCTGVRGSDRDDMLVNMIPVHAVQMAVMKSTWASWRIAVCPQFGPCWWAWSGWCASVQVIMQFLSLLAAIRFIAFRGTSYRALHRLDYLGVRNGIEIEYVLVSGVKSGSGAYCR